MRYAVGQKIYYTGDTANIDGWFEIVNIVNDNYCRGYDLQEIDGDRVKKRVPEVAIADVYDGTGRYRFVTEFAYKKYEQQQRKLLDQFIKKYSRQ